MSTPHCGVVSAAPSAPLTHATASALALPLHYERASGVIVDANDGNVAVVCRHKDQKAIEAAYALVAAANRAPVYDEMLSALCEAQSFLLDRFGHANAPHDARALNVLSLVSAALPSSAAKDAEKEGE